MEHATHEPRTARTRGAALAAAAFAALAVAACGPAPDMEAADGSAAEAEESRTERASPDPVREAVAILTPTEGNDVRGMVRFETLETGGARVTAEVSGLAAGTHAYHVHTFGDCTAPDGTSAGPHFPLVPLEEGAEPDFITGNLGELQAAEDGSAHVTREIPMVELNGPRAIPGRAVVVHRRGNDPAAAPSGDTGPRVACGVIGIAPAS